MLRADFSLVGLEGVLMPTFPNAPEGCATVQIDWKSAGYDDEKYGDLPPFVNVPVAHLELVQEATQKPEATRPTLGLVKDETPHDAPQNDEGDEKPRLRLI